MCDTSTRIILARRKFTRRRHNPPGSAFPERFEVGETQHHGDGDGPEQNTGNPDTVRDLRLHGDLFVPTVTTSNSHVISYSTNQTQQLILTFQNRPDAVCVVALLGGGGSGVGFSRLLWTLIYLWTFRYEYVWASRPGASRLSDRIYHMVECRKARRWYAPDTYCVPDTQRTFSSFDGNKTLPCGTKQESIAHVSSYSHSGLEISRDKDLIHRLRIVSIITYFTHHKYFSFLPRLVTNGLTITIVYHHRFPYPEAYVNT